MLKFKKTRLELSGAIVESYVNADTMEEAKKHIETYFRTSSRAETFEEFQDKKGTISFRTKDKSGKIILELSWVKN